MPNKPMFSKSSLLLTLIVASFAATVLVGSSSAQESQGLCASFPTHQRYVAVRRFKKPPVLKYYLDPAFGARVIRISDGEKGTVVKPAYSTMQAWNADESLLLLYHTGNGQEKHALYDGRTYRFLKFLNITPVDLEEIFWSHTDPKVLFYVKTTGGDYGSLMQFNVSSGKQLALKDLSKYCTGGLATAGGDVQMQSYDDDLFGFRCSTKKGPIMLSYRISTDEIVTRKIGEGTPWSEWTAPAPAPSGKLFLKDGKSIGLDLKTVLHTLDQAEDGEHASLGRNANGEDMQYQTVYDPSPKGCDGQFTAGVGHVTAFNLKKGKCSAMVTETEGWPYTASGTHISSLAHNRPGLIAVSSIGYGRFKFLESEIPAPALTSEIYLVDATTTPATTCRLAQHRSYGKDATTDDYQPYFGEPHATLSPNGTRIVYGSDWYDSGSVDTYVIELPAYQR